MTIYGLNIPNESPFWDEVKLRAMNNYGDIKNPNDAHNKVSYALESVCNDLFSALVDSEEARMLKHEIITDIKS